MKRANEPEKETPIVRYEIRSPVANFTGDRCGIRIVEGVGHTNDNDTAEWFKSNGYTVRELPA